MHTEKQSKSDLQKGDKKTLQNETRGIGVVYPDKYAVEETFQLLKIPLFKIYGDEEDVKSVTEAIKLGMNWVVGSNIGRKEIQNDRDC
jgi:hypothetical protein